MSDQQPLSVPKRLPWLALKVAVTATILYWALSKSDWKEIYASRTGLVTAEFAFAVAIMALQPVLASVRWEIVLSAMVRPSPSPSLRQLLSAYFVGLFVGQALPSTVGADLVRAYYARKIGSTYDVIFTSIFLERLISFAVLVGLAWIALTMGSFTVGANGEIAAYLVWLLGGVVVVCLTLLLVRPLRRVVPASFGSLKILAVLEAAGGTLKAPRTLIATVALSVLSQGAVITSAYVMARALGLEVTFLTLLLVLPVVMVAAMVPVSLSGWGVREGALVVLLGPFGVAPTQALILGVYIGISTVIISAFGIVPWLADRKPRQ